MGPELTASGARTACPSCGGRVRADATFCGQCYADFRPRPAAAPLAPAPTATYGVPAADPLTAPLLDVVLPAAVPAQGGPLLSVPPVAPAAPSVAPLAAVPPVAPVAPPAAVRKTATWPCTRCQAVNELSAPVCTVCGAPFLLAVAEESKVSLVLPVVGDLSRYGRGQRALIALGALMVVLVPLALITLLLTHAPPADPGPTPPATSYDGSGGSAGSTTGAGTGYGATTTG